MYTRCSECETLFRVTREQLNAARGRVRCGRCGNVFDALSSLHEEFAPLGLDPESRREVEPVVVQSTAPTEGAVVDEAVDVEAAPPPFLLVDDRRKRWPWVLLAVVALAVLAAQLAHMNRATLAEDAALGPFITKTYDAFGVPLGVPLRYDLDAFALLHHELATHPRRGGALHLSGVLSNEAAFAQPWPVLELRLEDRFGDVIAARRLRPDEYLRNPPSLNERMPPHARRAIEVELVDPGHDAVGFSINFCAEIDGVLRCAATTSGSY